MEEVEPELQQTSLLPQAKYFTYIVEEWELKEIIPVDGMEEVLDIVLMDHLFIALGEVGELLIFELEVKL